MTLLPFPHQQQKALKEFSTFKIGGPARFLAEAHTPEEMQEMLRYTFQARLPTLILGKGSNTLFDDRGYKGLVILNKIDFLHEEGEGHFRVGAGYSFARLGNLTSRGGWSGLEFAAGIPATVGGAIYMNAGANGQETADTLARVHYITEEGESRWFEKEELEWSYRMSVFQKLKGAIVEGLFFLHSSQEAKQRQREMVDYRLKTQPYKCPSAGCAFRNPPGGSAGRLIDELGWKGMKIGGAAISELHANFIINQGGATAQDVRTLIERVKAAVWEKKGIALEEEIRFIPYDHPL